MQVKIYSLRGTQYEGDAVSINAMTEAGEITVLDHHRPLVTILKPCDLRVEEKDGTKKIIPALGGFLEVGENNEVTVLID
ncbi:MAG: F0F1 ATP synthase subunit epsilon [bacterium]